MAINGSLLINRYQLLESIGAGGMGVVYRGLDTQTQQAVAIKKLKTDEVSDITPMIARFQREGEALRRLNHPNIVKMLDAFTERNEHYLVMELVEGGSLADMLTKPIAIANLLSICLDVADALTRAHRLNIIHRDLKPANVLIATDGTPRLSDFGIAYVGKQHEMTESGAIVGTSHYLAPEILKGAEPSPSSDIWALGVLLFELVAGKKPFDGTQMSVVFAAILFAPTPDLEALRPDAPIALVDLVYRLLDKDPQTRISSVRIVGAELEALLQGKTTPLPTPKITLDVSPPLSEGRFATPTPTPNALKHNLPANLTPFVGREIELAEVAKLLHAPQNRFVSILASGGMGKTRLSIETARRELLNFANGVYLVELAPLSSAESIPGALALAMGFQFYPGKPESQQIIDYLRERQVLLVMDNFEHLLEGAAYMSEILKHAPQVKILATSRESLNLQEEVRFRLSGLDFPTWETPEDALEFSAVKLFMQSARRVLPNFELNADDLNYLARICRLVRGMPLGIVLAAAWVNTLTPAEIADEISTSLDFLETDSRNIPDRHQSIRAVFTTSWEKLSAAEQRVFAQMSVFRGGFSRKAAQTITGVSLRMLNTLVDKSLLLRNADSGTYDVHELLRQYAEEALDEMGLAETTSIAHCEYYCQALAERNEALHSREQINVLNDIEADLENVKVAWDWAIDHHLWTQLGQAIEPLVDALLIRNHFKEYYEIIQKTTQLQPQNLACPERIVWARLRLHWDTLTEAVVREIIDDLQVCGAEQYTASAYKYLADIYGWEKYDYAEAENLLQQAIAIATRHQDISALAEFYLTLGQIKSRQNDRKQSREYFLLALQNYESRGDLNGIARSTVRATYSLTDIKEILSSMQKARTIYEQLGNRAGIAELLWNSGWFIYNEHGDIAEARRLILEAIAIYKETGQTNSGANANLAYIEYDAGNIPRAKFHLNQVMQTVLPEHFARSGTGCASLIVYAFIVAEEKHWEHAVELLGSLHAHPAAEGILNGVPKINDRLNNLVLPQLKAELSPEDYQAAWERGAKFDYAQLHHDMLKELAQP